MNYVNYVPLYISKDIGVRSCEQMPFKIITDSDKILFAQENYEKSVEWNGTEFHSTMFASFNGEFYCEEVASLWD